MNRETIRRGITLRWYPSCAAAAVLWRGNRLGSIVGTPNGLAKCYRWTFETGRASGLNPDRRCRGPLWSMDAAIALVYAHLRARRREAAKHRERMRQWELAA